MIDLPPLGPDQTGRIAVVGAGFMGAVIATIYAHGGYRVCLCDVRQQLLESFGERAAPIVKALVASGEEAADLLSRIDLTGSIAEAVAGAFLVQEAVQESLPVKQAVFADLDRLCGRSTILATNTSSFLLTDICRDVLHRDRVVGIHYITPAHIIRSAEVIYADFTPREVVDWSRSFLETIGHVGVACRERPGFMVNRLQYALLAECYRILDEGYATIEDIDAAVRLSIGPRLALWGPLMTEDLVANKATALAVTAYLHEQTGEPAYAPRSVLRDMVTRGDAGALSGRGWYEWAQPHPEIVMRRDAQLADLLGWLAGRDAHGSVGVAVSGAALHR